MRCFLLFSLLFLTIPVMAQPGLKIAYIHWQDTLNDRNWIQLMDTTGQEIRRVTDFQGSLWMPLADSGTIWYFLRKDQAAKGRGLYRLDLASGREERLQDARGLYFDIDQDRFSGRYVGSFLHQPDPASASRYDIFLFTPDGAFRVPLTRDAAMDADPVFSPDGQRIAFRSNRDHDVRSWKDFDIYTMDRHGTDLRRLTFYPDSNREQTVSNLAWLPDGRIAFSGLHEGGIQVMVMQPDGSDLHPLIPMPDIDQTGFDITPDMSQVVFCGRKRGARNSDLYLVRIDGSGFRQLTRDWRKRVQPFFVRE